jgi:hypothetical protein
MGSWTCLPSWSHRIAWHSDFQRRTVKSFLKNLIPDKLPGDTGQSSEYIHKGYDYVSALKPKPVKKILEREE